MSPVAMPETEKIIASDSEVKMTKSLNIIVCGAGIAGKSARKLLVSYFGHVLEFDIDTRCCPIS